MNEVLAMILEPVKALYDQVAAFFPNMLAMLIVVLTGTFAARLIRAVLIRALKAVRFDAWSDRMGFTSMLRKGDLWSKPSIAVTEFLFWLLIGVAVLTGMSALHIQVIDSMIAEVLMYVPRIVSAVLILTVGYILSGFVSRGLLISLVNSGFHFAKQLARAVRLLLFVLIIAMALEQLRVAPTVVVAAFSIVFGGIVLALSISFGVAGIDLAKRMLGQQTDNKPDPARDIQHV